MDVTLNTGRFRSQHKGSLAILRLAIQRVEVLVLVGASGSASIPVVASCAERSCEKEGSKVGPSPIKHAKEAMALNTAADTS
jgi:hypothetical protein